MGVKTLGRRLALLFATALVIAGCNSSNDPKGSLRVVHAVSDAPRVNVFLNDKEILSDVDFREISKYLRVKEGFYDVRVEAIAPGDDIVVIDEDQVEIVRNTWTTVVAAGDVTEDSIQPLLIPEPTDKIESGNFRLRVTHASPEAPPVYIALTAPADPIDQATLLGPFSYTQTTDPLPVAAGEYRIRVTLAPQPVSDADVVFDTGPLDLPAGADLHAFAVTSTVPSTAAPNGSPISIAVGDGDGGFDLFDVNTGSNLRVVHNSPGAPPVDVFVDVNDTMMDEDLEIVTNLAYGESAGYLDPAVAATSYNVGVRVSPGAGASDVLNFDADLMAGMGYTVLANNVVAEIEELILVDDYRPVATESKVRLVHGSPSAGVVDVYVFASADMLLPTDVDEPLLAGFEFREETGFLSLAPDTYDIYITAAGDDVPVISVTGLPVVASGVYTAIARDPNPLDPGDTDFGVTLIADAP